MLSWLQLASLKLQHTKCEFLKISLVYLGHIISRKGVQMDGHKIEAIRDWLVPITVSEFRRFLGFSNYYRCFIKDYAKVTCLHYDQISGDNAAHKKRKIQWMDECWEAFDKLKVLCTSTPILAFANFN